MSKTDSPQKQVHVPTAAPQPAEAAPPDTKKRTTTTLADLGSSLPVGLGSGGNLIKSLSTRVWTTRQEKVLAKFKKPNMNIAQHVAIVLGTMCSEFGNHSWEMPEKPSDLVERRLAIAQAAMGDVLYAYCYMRREAMGNIIKMNVTCPSCAHKFVFPADLDTLEVVSISHTDALHWTYKMQVPVNIRNKKVSALRMGPTMWQSMEMAAGGVINDAASKIAVLRGAIIGFDDDPTAIQMTEADLDDFHKRDLEGAVAALNDAFVGPKMALDGDCEKCERPFAHPIDWRYDSFFSSSSR
jgi:hypothetical protein